MHRLVSLPALTARLGQNIIVDNRSGAAGQLGLEMGARAAPDGYTMVGGQGGNLVVQPHTYKKLPYDPLKDFVPIANSTTNFLVLVTGPNVPFKSVRELIQEINRAISAPDVKEKLGALGLTVLSESPEQFAQTLKSDYEKYGKLIKAIGLQPQ